MYIREVKNQDNKKIEINQEKSLNVLNNQKITGNVLQHKSNKVLLTIVTINSFN